MPLLRENNYYKWEKGESDPLTKHFMSNEFSCHCSFDTCKEQRISVELVEKLEQVRVALNAPVIIDSAYRCKAKQDALRAAGYETSIGPSTHELGDAVDVRPALNKFYSLGQELKQRFKAIGEATSWYHVDMRADKPRYWFYYKR